jgi:uncharacterized membrane protein
MEGIVTKRKVLLVGETWVSSATHTKGFDLFHSATQHSGAGPLLAALADSDFAVEHMSAQDCVEAFPLTLEGLKGYEAIMLSDIGTNSFLLHPDVWLHGKPVPNRLKLLREWTAGGGGLVMVGGYLTFQGIDGKARWRRTAVEDALPVQCLPFDDRLEIPDGFRADVVNASHPLVRGILEPWPLLLGANEVIARTRMDCEVVVRLPHSEGGHPLLVCGSWGEGRSVAWTSDVGPHWAPVEFTNWTGYKTLWRNVLSWVTRSGD